MEWAQKRNMFLVIIFVWGMLAKNNVHANSANPSVAMESAINKITWLKDIVIPNSNDVKINGRPKRPTASNPSKYYKLALNARDELFDSCVTPRYESGHCRYIQHCVSSDFTNNFRVFLKYLCFIKGQYVGVCCPDSRKPTTQPPAQSQDWECGVNNKQQTKIVGGSPARADDYPWMAALVYAGEKKAFCGGVLITTRHVLTAAHCVRGHNTYALVVRLGEYTFNDGDATKSKDFSLKSIRMHERYNNKEPPLNDIAMLTLYREVNEPHIWPICLPPLGKSFARKSATVIGWGTNKFKGQPSNVLREVTIPVWDNSECDEAYKACIQPHQCNTWKIFDENICAGDKKGGKGSCQGDSGGPLMYHDVSNHKWMVIGLVSYGACGSPKTPGVYARVSEYLSWIEQHTST